MTINRHDLEVGACAIRSTPRDVQRCVVTALHHLADIDGRQIAVDVDDRTVTLTGTVHTWMERDTAERAALSAPGITGVINRIVVMPVNVKEAAEPDEIC